MRPRIAADGAYEACGCLEYATEAGLYTPTHGYGPQVIVTKSGRRWRASYGAPPGAEPGESDRWEDVGPAPAVSESAPASRRRAASPSGFSPPAWLRGLVAEIRTWAHETFARVDRLDALERKLAELETRSGSTATASALADAYAGVHVDGKRYERGQLVTFGGSLWLAMRDNADARPGKSDDWRLIVKHGRDAREAR